MNRTLSIIILSLMFISFGCKQSRVKKTLLPGVSGKAGEVLIVMDKPHWEGSAGQLIRDVFLEDVPGLPQSEPLLNPVNIPHRAFSELFRIHRNIIIVKISDKISEGSIKTEKNKWAQPQTIIYISAPNRDAFMNLWNEKGEKVLAIVLKAEQDRLTNNYKKYVEHSLVNKLQARTGVNLTIPAGYTYDLDTNNFVWLSHETPQISQGIFVYYYDYKDTASFTQLDLINKRNEMLKKYVAGPRDGSYMTTELQILPEFRSYNYKGNYTAELRGLWKVEGDYMGGPFVSLSQFDKTNNRVVTVEGYVYAPKFDKRNYIRQLEAILYSLKFAKLEE